MTKVTVLGGSGMLGSMVTDVLSRVPGLQVTATVRTRELAARFVARHPHVQWKLFDAATADRAGWHAALGRSAWVVNAIGITKPYAHDDNPAEVERAVRINALMPFELGHVAAECGARVLQIATDCVYSGTRGAYTEKDQHDPLDVYGKTKSLGEAALPNVHHLRCSIVGPEAKSTAFLLEWFRGQPHGAQVNGFVNHYWNGVTTLHFARLCQGVIVNDLDLPHLQHVLPGGPISKADLLRCFAHAYRREDVTVKDTEAKVAADRTLATLNPDLNRRLWAAAGYADPPGIPQMVDEMARLEAPPLPQAIGA